MDAPQTPAPASIDLFLSQQELAKRWGRTETAICLASAVGVGPRYVKMDGAIKYPVEDVQRYERTCLTLELPTVVFRA